MTHPTCKGIKPFPQNRFISLSHKLTATETDSVSNLIQIHTANMNRILFGVIAALAGFILVDSLTCNQCSFGIAGFCLSSTEVTCETNTSQCFTGKATFSISSVGFNTQGCIESTSCNMTTNNTLLGVTYEAVVECCSTDNCNPVQTSAATPSAKITLTTAIGAAVLASMLGSLLTQLSVRKKKRFCGGAVDKTTAGSAWIFSFEVPQIAWMNSVSENCRCSHRPVFQEDCYFDTRNADSTFLIINAAYGLNCRQCPVSLLDICLFGSDITCDNSTQACYRGNAVFNGTLPVRLYARGCLDEDLCQLTINDSALGAPFTATFDCCVTDLCNGATHVQLSLTMAVGVALFSLWVM
uniref:uncharacterized protein LOC131102187 n=1 Tax=Doryrhamphus excisus TaxID=161450 RepID=UPI0025AE4787|nr:uncharacterized protein LOC131102187 [Doryrhamphus excisus]